VVGWEVGDLKDPLHPAPDDLHDALLRLAVGGLGERREERERRKRAALADHVVYAGAKAAWVRRLPRTTARIPYAEGEYKAKVPPRIEAGLLTYESSWTPPFGEPLLESLDSRPGDERLDLGCVASHGTFEAFYAKTTEVIVYDKSEALIAFLVRLLARLQALGTVPAIDYEA
jgi:hypothetical protein